MSELNIVLLRVWFLAYKLFAKKNYPVFKCLKNFPLLNNILGNKILSQCTANLECKLNNVDKKICIMKLTSIRQIRCDRVSLLLCFERRQLQSKWSEIWKQYLHWKHSIKLHIDGRFGQTFFEILSSSWLKFKSFRPIHTTQLGSRHSGHKSSSTNYLK